MSASETSSGFRETTQLRERDIVDEQMKGLFIHFRFDVLFIHIFSDRNIRFEERLIKQAFSGLFCVL